MMAGGTRWDNGFMLTAAYVTALAIVYMANSTGLITFNKHLMHDDRFPFAIFLGLVHMTCSFGFNAILFSFCPTLYPSLTDEQQKVEIDRGLLGQVLLPIAACFSGQLILSNLAFLHSSVAFLLMMKESNVVLVYLFSLVLGLECFGWKRAWVLLFIVMATALTIHGEMHFSAAGFTTQGFSMLFESMKLTLQSYSLSATGKRLDALTYVMLVAPLVFLVLGILLLLLALLWPGRPEALSFPPWPKIADYKWLLLANGCLAFAMNISHALFIKNSSAITFILTGIILKDVMIVVVGSLIFGRQMSVLQEGGFAMQLMGVLIWSLMKASAPPAPLVTEEEDHCEDSPAWQPVVELPEQAYMAFSERPYKPQGFEPHFFEPSFDAAGKPRGLRITTEMDNVTDSTHIPSDPGSARSGMSSAAPLL
mmetsp:Transcript_97283/g.217094  ORF Transcript_97283/g.217094 Transcript_97283/m.217094 type:complete len:423 (-) Transcript_97283:97-1365(-)